MVPIALWDTLSLKPTPSIDIHCQCHDALSLAPDEAFSLPTDDHNLAVRALHLLRDRARLSRGAELHLMKRIPIAAGLAGGSSDAAAALVAGNLAWDLHWPTEKLCEIASELGSDVPFFLTGAPAVCRARGERIEPLSNLAPLNFVVVQPPVALSTAQVYARCQPAAARGVSAQLIDAWRRGLLSDVGQLLQNGLQQAAASITHWIERLRGEFARFDFLGHQMTGSGSAYFGVCRHARQARRLAAALRSRGYARSFAVRGLT